MKRLLFAFCGAALLISIGLVGYFQIGSAHEHKKVSAAPASSEESGPLTTATVSFGGWMTTPALDRFPNSNPITAVYHELTPKTVTIKQGGTVRFIIGGFHNVAIYDDGTQPDQINTNLTISPTNGGPPLINDPNNRIYRGLDPSLFPQDRVEVVQFDEPGTYLVICAVRIHFADGMFGFVRVLPGKED